MFVPVGQLLDMQYTILQNVKRRLRNKLTLAQADAVYGQSLPIIMSQLPLFGHRPLHSRGAVEWMQGHVCHAAPVGEIWDLRS